MGWVGKGFRVVRADARNRKAPTDRLIMYDPKAYFNWPSLGGGRLRQSCDAFNISKGAVKQ